jgi:hypothetical protein
VVQPDAGDPSRLPNHWIGAPQPDGSVPEVLLVHADPKVYTHALPPLPSGVQPSFLWVVPGGTLARPPIFFKDYMESHGLKRLGSSLINWGLIKGKYPKVAFPKITPEVIERWQTPLYWISALGWTPAVYNGEKFFDSRYNLPQNQGDLLRVPPTPPDPGPTPGDRWYLIDTPKDGQSRYLAMKKKVDATAAIAGDNTWAILQGLADAGARLDTQSAETMGKMLTDMRKFYADIVRDAGKMAGGPFAIMGQIVGWLWETFLHGAGDNKAKINTKDSLDSAARRFAMCLALGFPPSIAGLAFPWFTDPPLDGSPTHYSATLDEITRRADRVDGLQKAHQDQFMSLPKAAREVIQTWWFLALEQIGKDAHAKAAFAALMAGKAGAYNMACDEQVYLVGYTMALRYEIDPAQFIPALWNAAAGWSRWNGLASITGQGGSPPQLMAYIRANPDAAQLQEIDEWEPQYVPLDSPTPGKLGAVLVSGAHTGFWAKADNSEYEGPAPAPKPIGVKRVVGNSTALNWFDLCYTAFVLAEKHRIDWHVSGVR